MAAGVAAALKDVITRAVQIHAGMLKPLERFS
jgi:hypothetical protein